MLNTHIKGAVLGIGALALLILAVPVALAESGQASGPGRVGLKILAGRDHVEVGSGAIWNSRDQLHLQLDPAEGWRIKGYQVDMGGGEDYSPPLTPTGNPKVGQFDYQQKYTAPYANPAAGSDNIYRRTLVLDLEEDLEFQWGAPWAEERTQGVAIFLKMVSYDACGRFLREEGAWVVPELVVWEEELAAAGSVGDGEVIADAKTGRVVADAINLSQGRNLGRGVVGRKENQRCQHLVQVDVADEVIEFEGGRWGWWFIYEMGHPLTGHFIDAPVAGLHVETPTYEGLTGTDSAFDYFPGEYVSVSLGDVLLGSTVADKKISPLDLFENGDVDDVRVINLARLLQSLDVDGDPQGGIVIIDEVTAVFEQAVASRELETLDFADSVLVEDLIDHTILLASQLDNPVYLVKQSSEAAQDHLNQNTDSFMFRRDISRTPELESAKSKMAISSFWYPALAANATPEDHPTKTLEYRDEEGNLIRTMTEAHPIVITYTDNHDCYAAVSMDDGETFKRMNLSRTADLTSFTLADGTPYYGDCKKPVVQVKNNMILVSWSSKYCRGGRPRFAIKVDDPATPDVNETEYPYDDPYYTEDVWGVGGPQRSHDYTEDGFPEVGEVPYSAVWACRGIIATAADVTAGRGAYVGDIVWFKPERIGSGRRDALQIFMAAASGAGFAMVWQEDPEGLKPGKAVGPGPGWGGATTAHKTDIWYNYIGWADFALVDTNFEPAYNDPEEDEVYSHPDVSNRPKALVPMSLPVRLSDNDVVNTDNILVELDGNGYPVLDESGNYIPIPNAEADSDGDGTHRYATVIPGLIADWYDFVNEQGESKRVAVTADGRLLDGDTGASRPNIFLQTYQYLQNGVLKNSAWAIVCYEETKGAGAGPPETEEDDIPDEDGNGNSDAYIPEEGKNVIYHSFDLKRPDLCSAGDIMNMPEAVVDANGDPILDGDGNIQPVYLTDEFGQELLDFRGRPILAYENARRGRFLPQGVGAVKLGGSRTSQLMVYKQGPEGAGRSSDILMQRWVVPAGVTTLVGTATQPIPHNPYCFADIVGTRVYDERSEQWYWGQGPVNMSSVTPRETTDSSGDPDQEDAYGAVKVINWDQTAANFSDLPAKNPYDDARAHRGTIRGDWVTVGFSYTPNWAAARNGHDKYDFYIRRSYDGGVTWTTDPNGSGTEHCTTWTYPSGTQEAGTKVEECFTAGPGEFERMRNLSRLDNAKESVIEPRIVAVPGTYKINNQPTGVPEDVADNLVYYVAYGTSTNPIKDPVTGEQEEPAPQDLYWSFTRDMGETYHLENWVINPDSDGENAGEEVYRWGWMAKGDAEQGEVQLRMTPDGSKFYACWLDDGEEASDIAFRRIMSLDFPQNVGGAPVGEPLSSLDGTSADDYSTDSGGEDD